MDRRLADYIQEYPIEEAGSQPTQYYKGLFINSGATHSNHCILVLSGTSIQLEDIKFFIDHLADRGYCVASIERNVGHILQSNMHPKTDRKLVLKNFIHHLKENCGIKKIDIIAQSYASFEVVRVLSDTPDLFRPHVSNIIFANPAGFDNGLKYIPHCLRFLFIHILSEYIRTIRDITTRGIHPSKEMQRYRRKLKALNSFFIKTILNPARTFREILDIVSFDIIPNLKSLVVNYGYVFHFVLNNDDNLVAVSKTHDWALRLVPREKIILFPGNHLDCFIDERQVLSIMKSIEIIVSRGRYA